MAVLTLTVNSGDAFTVTNFAAHEAVSTLFTVSVRDGTFWKQIA